MEQLVREYGYLAIVLVTFFEGESIVILAGAAARWGYLDVAGVVVAALAGSIAGDQIWYYAGRWWGCELFSRNRLWESRAEKVFARLRRHDTWLILTFRFYYGLRTVTPFAIGAGNVPRMHYLILNVTGGVVWAIAFTVLGYSLGEAGGRLTAEITRYGACVLLGLLVAGAVVWFVRLRGRPLQDNPAQVDTPSYQRTSRSSTRRSR